MVFENLSVALSNAFSGLLVGVVEFIPQLIVAVLVLIVGWLIGAALSKVVSQIIKALKVDKALEAAGAKELVGKAGFQLNSGVFVGELVKWFVVAVSFIATFDILGLQDVNSFLEGVVLGYIPQVIAAVLILLVAVVVGTALQRTVIASAKAAGFASANFLGAITKWSIWVFALLAALFQLNIAATFIQTLFTGFVVALALAAGLAFGIGGKDVARDYLEKLRKEVSERD